MWLKLTSVVLMVLIVSACSKGPDLIPPADKHIAASIASLYVHAGVAGSVLGQKLLGKHYSPSTDSWDVVACIDLANNDNPITDCNDSFTLVGLDTGRWVVKGTVNGVYRWVEVTNKAPEIN